MTDHNALCWHWEASFDWVRHRQTLSAQIFKLEGPKPDLSAIRITKVGGELWSLGQTLAHPEGSPGRPSIIRSTIPSQFIWIAVGPSVNLTLGTDLTLL
jgi:hypothetical protein